MPEVPRDTVAESSEHERPVEGRIEETARLMFPLKPLRGLRLIEEEPEPPLVKLREAGLAEIPKSQAT